MTSTTLENHSSYDRPPAEQTKPPVADQFVSVIIPCYNEEKFILKALEQLVDQYDHNNYEIIIVDAMSTDNSRRLIDDFAKQSKVSIVLVDNPARNIPTALNLGIAAARGSIVARMDAHAVPSSGYIRRCVEVLRDGQAAVVGMPCVVRPGDNGVMALGIASAVSHKFGIGDATYRLVDTARGQQSVDTVAFGCFRKSVWQNLGGFNEDLLTNEDYDFNYRVRLSGQQVVLDSAEHSDYFARTTLRELARQYWRYGHWKAKMIKLHPRSIRLRHAIAPTFVLSIVLLIVAGLFWPPALALLALELLVYFSLALFFGFQIANRARDWKLTMLMPLIFFTIHVTWGTSFVFGLVSLQQTKQVMAK